MSNKELILELERQLGQALQRAVDFNDRFTNGNEKEAEEIEAMVADLLQRMEILKRLENTDDTPA